MKETETRGFGGGWEISSRGADYGKIQSANWERLEDTLSRQCVDLITK